MIVLYFLLAAGIPLVASVAVIAGKWRNGWLTLALVLLAIASTVYSSFIAPWYSYSYWILLVIWLVAIAAVVIGIMRLRRTNWSRPSAFGILAATLLIAGASYLGANSMSAVSAMNAPTAMTDLEFPLRDGVYAITQGGSAPPLQAGHARAKSQKFALDVVKLNAALYSGGAWLTLNQANAEILGETVYSPCDGSIVLARDGLPNTPVFEGDQPAGNLVVVACDDIVVAFGHLETSSIAVSVGDNVTAGTPIGKVGLSGRTFGPHLHFHAEKGEWQGDQSDNPPAAMSFDQKFLWTNRIVIRE